MMLRAAPGARRASTLAASTATGAHWPCWIDNADAEAVGGATLPLENPATGRVVGSCAAGDAATIDAAVASSAAAFPGWRDLGAIGRGRVLRRAADLLRRDLPAVVHLETLHTGRPAREYVAQLGRVPEWLEYHASLAETSEGTVPPFGGDGDHLCYVERAPLGVCGLPCGNQIFNPTSMCAYATVDASSSAVLRELDESNRFVQRSAESTSM